MVASIVVRTKIAKFGPGQFKFVLAKTEIAVFGPGQHHLAHGGERFRRIFARARAPEGLLSSIPSFVNPSSISSDFCKDSLPNRVLKE